VAQASSTRVSASALDFRSAPRTRKRFASYASAGHSTFLRRQTASPQLPSGVIPGRRPRRVTSPPVSSCVRCRLEDAATNVAAPPRPTSSAQGRKDPRTLPPGRPQFQAWPPWCRRRSRRSPDRSGRWRVSLPRLRRGRTAERRPRSLPVLRRIALGHRRRFQFDAGRRDSGRSRLEPALPRR
jgi:hypothetical protein